MLTVLKWVWNLGQLNNDLGNWNSYLENSKHILEGTNFYKSLNFSENAKGRIEVSQ